MNISVIGAGYVGLTKATCLSQIGLDVFCSESDIYKLTELQNGSCHFLNHISGRSSQAPGTRLVNHVQTRCHLVLKTTSSGIPLPADVDYPAPSFPVEIAR